jgi:hypothetical protein
MGAWTVAWHLALAPQARGQSFPIPVAPPLPMPPLPVPELRVEPAPPAPEVPTEPLPSASFNAMVHASSKAEREALLRSRLHETWYGWQTLSVDAVAVGILLVGAAFVTSRPPTLEMTSAPRPVAFAAASVGVYAVGPPVVHFAHGRPWEGLASVGLRVVMPLAGFALGYWASGELGSWSGQRTTDGALVGVVVGAGAMAADAAALGWDRSRPPAQSRTLLSARASF